MHLRASIAQFIQ